MKIRNPAGVGDPGKGYRFLLETETREDATHFWSDKCGEWLPKSRGTSPLIKSFTYRTNKILPMNPKLFHNPANLASAGQGFRFLLKTEKRQDATDLWDGGWFPLRAERDQMTTLFPDVTYRTNKPLKYPTMAKKTPPKKPVPAAAIAHGYADKPITADIDTTLDERGKRYGTFAENAAVAQELKQTLAKALMGKNVEPYVQEALDMFCSKLSRIVTGDPTYVDNWTDLEGFSKLVRLNLEGNTR